ncbi:universal stress protein [Aeromonas schubertii]
MKNGIVLLLEGKAYERETLAKASRLAHAMGSPLTLLHLTHSSQVRNEHIELPDAERSARAELAAKAGISELVATLSHPAEYQCLAVDDVVRDLAAWLATHPSELLLVGSRHHWMEGSLARLLLYKLPVDIQICHEPVSERVRVAG